MKSFLCKGKQPICKWGSIPHGVFYEGEIPDGFSLAVCPSEGYIVIDIDVHGYKNGFENIPEKLKLELSNTLHYPTKNKGMHFWFKYTGNKPLANKASKYSIDLRTSNGYVIWYPKYREVRESMKYVMKTSNELNDWLEELFSYKH